MVALLEVVMVVERVEDEKEVEMMEVEVMVVDMVEVK